VNLQPAYGGLAVMEGNNMRKVRIQSTIARRHDDIALTVGLWVDRKDTDTDLLRPLNWFVLDGTLRETVVFATLHNFHIYHLTSLDGARMKLEEVRAAVRAIVQARSARARAWNIQLTTRRLARESGK
jgi:hypothetical protein